MTRRTSGVVALAGAAMLLWGLAWRGAPDAFASQDTVSTISDDAARSAPPASTLPFALAGLRQLLQPADRLHQEAIAASARAAPGMIRAAGAHLVLDGEPWRFVGFNDYQLTSQSYSGYTCGGEHSDAEVAADFAQMHRLGVTVVRTWFFQSYVAGRDWSAFDRVLQAASENGIRVIAVLGNQWGDCEDFNRSPVKYKGLDWYEGGYRSERDYGLPQSYRDYALKTAQHYATDTRVAFWQLVNEAEAADYLRGRCQETVAARALRSFADDMAGAIKTADPNHLVSLGTIGGGQCGTAGPDYIAVHAGAVDLCEGHDYTPSPWTAPRSNPCRALDKPTFIGERGFASDLGSGQTTPQTLATRAQYVRADIASAFGEDGYAGYVLWAWTDGSAHSYGAGDPAAAVVDGAAHNLGTGAAIYALVLWHGLRDGPPLLSGD